MAELSRVTGNKVIHALSKWNKLTKKISTVEAKMDAVHLALGGLRGALEDCTSNLNSTIDDATSSDISALQPGCAKVRQQAPVNEAAPRVPAR